MARFVAEQLAPDGPGRIEEFVDRTQEHSVDVLTCVDAPAPGLHTVSTLSLHRAPNLLRDSTSDPTTEPTDVRVELVTTLAGKDVDLITGLLVASSFAMVKEPWPMRPGTLFPDIVADLLGGRTEHLLFTAPGNYPRLNRYPLEPGSDVHWLQAVPIHESEREFLVERGLDALEDLLATAEAEFYDVDRPAVV